MKNSTASALLMFSAIVNLTSALVVPAASTSSTSNTEPGNTSPAEAPALFFTMWCDNQFAYNLCVNEYDSWCNSTTGVMHTKYRALCDGEICYCRAESICRRSAPAEGETEEDVVKRQKECFRKRALAASAAQGEGLM